MSRLKPLLLSFCVLLCVVLTAFVKSTDGSIDQIITALANWYKGMPQEKIYVHTDRPYYSVGDTIYFKTYLTTGSRHNLSGISGAVYVELMNEKGGSEKSVKLPVLAGMAQGSFVLDKNLLDGNYRLRAYTEWMRNAGSDFFYDHTFTVLKPNGGVYSSVNYAYVKDKNDPILQATLNFTTEEGSPLVNVEVKSEIHIGEKVTIRRGTADAKGNVVLDLPDGKDINYTGSYILTTINYKDKEITKVFSVTSALSQPDIQFFPEGGDMVYGINSRVAFKAIGSNGKGMDIKGTVIDNSGQEIASFASTHAGMGNFFLMPETGKTYSAKIALDDGSVMVVPMPKPIESGYVLSAFNTPGRDSLLLRVYASADVVQTQPTISLIGQTGGEVFYASQVKIARAMTSVWVPKQPFPSGVAQFTLFNANNAPLNERVVFISNNDSLKMALVLPKQTFRKREKVNMQLKVTTAAGAPTIGGYSMSVINEKKAPVEELDESTIFTNILLTSDLKGFIEQPNYYFIGDKAEKAADLDNLMLTQGYTRFVWKDILTGAPLTPKYQAEKLETVISGQLLTLGGKPLPNGKVILLSLANNFMRDTIADSEGKFSFKLLLPDSVKFSVQGRTPKDGNKLQIKLDKVSPQENTKNANSGEINTNMYKTRTTYLASKKSDEEFLQKMGVLNNNLLEDVKVTATKKTNSSSMKYFGIPDGSADFSFVPDEKYACTSLWLCLSGRLRGVVFKTDGDGYYAPYSRDQKMLLIVDGNKLNQFETDDVLRNSLTMDDILRVDVVLYSEALKTVVGGAAVFITTKRGFTRSSNEPSITNINPRGFSRIKEFYSPQYDVKNDEDIPDLRTTVYWDPNIKTGVDGRAIINYFNTDEAGTYRVVIEGISANGQLGRAIYRYKVE